MRFFLIIFCFIAISTNAQNTLNLPQINFKPFEKNNELPYIAVLSIEEDIDGLLWFGTTDGLCRYDGYRLKKFYTNPASKDGLSDNTVTGLTNFQQKIYTSSNEGTSYYDYKLKKFHQLDTVAKTTINKDFRIAFLLKEKKMLAFGTSNIYTIDEKNNVTAIPYNYNRNVSNKTFLGTSIISVTEDNKKNIWINSLKNILQLNPISLIVEQNIGCKELGTEGISSILFVGDNLWISTFSDKIKCYNVSTKKITNINTKDIHFQNISSFKDENNNTWLIAIGSKCYCIINPKTYEVVNYDFDTDINATFVDKKNTIWIATFKGLFYCEQTKKAIQSTPIDTYFKDKKEESVKIIIGTKENYYQLAGSGESAAQFDKNWNFIKTIQANYADTTHIAIGGIRSIYEAENYYWVTTWYKGLAKCTKDFKVVKWFPKLTNSQSDLRTDSRSFIPMGNDNYLVRGSFCLSIFNTKSEKFIKHFITSKDNPNSLPVGLMPSAVIVGNDCYFGTERIGFYKLNLKTDKVINIPLLYNNLQITKIIQEDSVLWISTSNGLVKYDIATQKSITFLRKDGLCSEKIFQMEFSKKNNTLWLCSYGGIIAFNTKTYKVNNYFNKDGLFDQSNIQRIFIDDNNKVFVGNGNYVSVFDQSIIEQNTTQKKSIITELLINNENVDWKFDKEQKYVTVPYNKNNIALHFTVASPTSNETFYYKLNDKWLTTPTGFVQFNNLAPGTYKIYVANLPNDTAINDFITITIKPPFYNTWWFYTLCLLGLGSVLYAFFGIRTQHIRKEFLMQKTYEQKLADSEMQTLRSQMNPHFVFNTMNSINSYIIQNKTALASEYLTTFSKLMRSILELSKQETVPLEKEINALKMYIELEALRLENKFDYSISIDKNIDEQATQIPSLMLQPFVENAIWHGLHNKADHGTIAIKIVEQNATQILVTIEDDGIGRVASAAIKQAQVNHKSYGIDITKNRLQLLNKNNEVIFTDLYNAAGKACGTKVSITISVQNENYA